MEQYVSSAAITVGNSLKDQNQSDSRSNLRSSPFYASGVQPVHPVLQRRNTPLHFGHQKRRLTQPVAVSFFCLDIAGGNENLSSDKTGRIPIPPPRGPRFKVGLSRNVSQNGLRSPQLTSRIIRSGTKEQPPTPPAPPPTFRPEFRAGILTPRPQSKFDRTTDDAASSRSKFYVDIYSSRPREVRGTPPSTPASSKKEFPGTPKLKHSVSGPLAPSSPRLNAVTQPSPSTPQTQRQSFDEIVDEIFKTIGTEEAEYSERCHRCVEDKEIPSESKGEDYYGTLAIAVKSVAGSPKRDVKIKSPYIERDLTGMESCYSQVKVTDVAVPPKSPYYRPSQSEKPSPVIHRSKSDVSRHKLRFKRPLSSLVPNSTVPSDLHSRGHDELTNRPRTMEWMTESTETHYSDGILQGGIPQSNVMQRMRKGFSDLRTGVWAKLNKQPQYTRKSSCPCDLLDDDVAEVAITSRNRAMDKRTIFYDGLVKPVDPSQNLDRTRKPTSADSGIVDIGHDGDEGSSSSRLPRPTSTEYSSAASASGCGSPMRRSRSQPPGRLVSFAAVQVEDKGSSDLDRSVSARSSRTSEASSGSGPAIANSTPPEPSASPRYIDSLWSQVKYEVDCEQNVADYSTEGMRANIVKEILKNERDFVDNLKDVIEGYLYKCRQRPDMFSKGRIECIFGNLEQLYEFQCEFLTDLESSIITNNVHRSEIGHCFLLHQRGFSDLYSDYCNNHSQSAIELQQLKQIKQYAHFFEACRMLQDMVEISLDGFLLQPVQKICKYPLQLCELLKYTTGDHPDCQSVKLALNAMKSVTGLINERKRRLECLEKIALWQETIDLWDGEDLVERSSQLVHYGDLNKLSSKNSWTHEYVFFLFDHQLIYCRRDIIKRTVFTYKGRFDMDQVEIVDLEQNDAGIKHGWVVVCPDKEQSTILLAKSLEDKKKWMRAFEEERKRVQTDAELGFTIAAKDRLTAIQTAKMLSAGKEKRSKTKDALKDLTDHTQLVQSMRSKSLSMTLPVRIRVGQTEKRANIAARTPFSNRRP